MAASVLCRRASRIRSLGKYSARAKLRDEAKDQEIRKSALHHDFAPPYDYNPTSYYFVSNFGTLQSCVHKDGKDESFSLLAPSFWQHGNRYSISCSRRLSSTKNTLLDLALDKHSYRKPTQMPPQNIPPDVKVNTRAFLKCRPEYASIALDLSQRPQQIEWDEAMLLLQKVTNLSGCIKPSDVTQFLADLSGLHNERTSLLRRDQRFIMLLQYTVNNLRLFTIPELLEVLQSFVWLEIPSSHSVLDLFEAELCFRAEQMSLHQLLLAADMWRCHRRQVPEFLKHLYRSVHMCHQNIGVPELVHLLYIIGERRSFPRHLIDPMKQLLLRYLRQLHPEEVGTVCLAMFKSTVSLSESTASDIVDEALKYVDVISDFALVNVMKCLRFNHLYHKEWIDAMTKEVPRRAHRMGVQGLMHVALTCSALHYRNDQILMAIADRVPLLVSHCRCKDLCKLLWAFGSLGFAPELNPNFYLILTDSLRQKKAEFQQYPQHLLTGLLGLAFVAQFPEDLIAFALSPKFVKLALKFKQLDLRDDLFTLDGVVALGMPHWNGPRLSPQLRQSVAEKLWEFAQSDVCQKPEVLEAESNLKDLLGGDKFVRKRMILPHTRSIDLEVHLDSEGRPIPVELESEKVASSAESTAPQTRSPLDWGQMKAGVTIANELIAQLKNSKNQAAPVTPSPPAKCLPGRTNALLRTGRHPPKPKEPQGIQKLAIQVANRNQYCYHSSQLLGLHILKRRQLKQAGYQVVELSYQDWFPLLRKSKFKKLAYLQYKVQSGR